MNLKLIFKISVLILALVLVIAGRQFFMSPGFHKNANDVFSVAANPFQWCSSKQNLFTWVEPKLAKKYSDQSQAQLAQMFCLILAETVQGVDLATIHWTPIAESVDSEGQKVVLDWNTEKKLFRANGLPFKSSSLSREINP
jgi:hypothetical protein